MQTPKVAVVTGAASGIGKAAATRWARQGVQVAAVDWSAEALKDLEASESRISAFECDVTDDEAVRRVAGEIASGMGDIDRIVNAAGICLAGRTGEIPAADFRRNMEVNYFGTVHWVDAVLGGMRARRHGEIVNLASIAGFLPTPGANAYVASKFAVLGFTETLAEEVHGDGIRVVAVCPPAVDTPMLDDIMSHSTLGPRMARFMKPITPDTVIDAIESALPGNKILVLPGSTTWPIFWMRRFAPVLTRRLLRLVQGL